MDTVEDNVLDMSKRSHFWQGMPVLVRVGFLKSGLEALIN